MDFHDKGNTHIFFTLAVIFCFLVTVSVILFAPQVWRESGQDKFATKQSLILGLLSTYMLSSYSFLIRTILPSNGPHSRLFFFESLWLFSALCSQIFKVLIFNHILYVLQLPTRIGDFSELLKKTESELIINAERTTRFWIICCILFGCVVVYQVVPSSYKKHHKSSHHYVFDAYSTFVVFWVQIVLYFITIKVLSSIYSNIRDRYVPKRILHKLRWTLVGEFACSFFSLSVLIIFTIKMAHDPNKYLSAVDDSGFCYMMLNFMISTMISLFTLFPLSFHMVFQLITNGCRRVLNGCDRSCAYVDDLLCCRTEHCCFLEDGYSSIPLSGVNVEESKQTILDFGFRVEGMSENANRNRVRLDTDTSGEQTIIREVGEALVNCDTSSMVIPPEFLKIDAIPFASGGFGQVHSGIFCGQKVAVKKVFTQLSEGLLNEFNHEVRILNNLRGMPHIMLLHGVSFQMDHGDRAFIMVLEWCPLSLSSLIYDKQRGRRAQEVIRNSQYSMQDGTVKNVDMPYSPLHHSGPSVRSSLSTNSSGKRSQHSNKQNLSIVGSAFSSGNAWLKQNLLNSARDGEDADAYDSGSSGSFSDGRSTSIFDPDSNSILSPRTFLLIAQQLVNAIYMLHYKGYVHRDLKPQNILFSNPQDLGSSLRICDFGTARITDDQGRCSLTVDLHGVSPLYSPPEVIPPSISSRDSHLTSSPPVTTRDQISKPKQDQNEPHSHQKVGLFRAANETSIEDERIELLIDDEDYYDGRAYDIYSLGIVIWEMWYKVEPEQHFVKMATSQQQAAAEEQDELHGDAMLPPPTDSFDFYLPKEVAGIFRKTQLGYRPSFLTESEISEAEIFESSAFFGDMPQALKDLLLKMWSQKPSERPSSADVKKIIDSKEMQQLIDAVHRSWRLKN